MKPITAATCLLLLFLIAFWAFEGAMPGYQADFDSEPANFSTDRAMKQVEALSEQPHGVGFAEHRTVREYLVKALESMGLEVRLQTGYTAGDWGNFSRATNIMARIPGSEGGNALVLLSHYDSSPHSSYGASDAGSGVATILEGVRAYLEGKKKHKNDLIILFTDAEELGLNGADLFVNQHPWVKDVRLVLNFEARGSGGPSYMLIETNRGNENLIKGFEAAMPDYPVANSLAYSIYKMLPNDTDLTVFREDADIEGFNFAFIDDHFDYHTALDIADRLDRNTLAHQGSYLMPLLNYFANAELGGLKSLNERVYFNVPFFKLLSYPYEWIWPMFLLAAVFFVVLLTLGFKNGDIRIKGVLTGFLPALFCLLLNALAGYYSWPILKYLYPGYADMLHGFTYNGYLYITALSSLAVGSCFWIYSYYKHVRTTDLLIAPALLWLVLCGFLNAYLPGAAFFLIPVYALLISMFIHIRQVSPNPFVLTALSIPALWIFAPFVKMFPVGLGLKMILASSVLSVLIFLLLLPVLLEFPKKKQLAGLGISLFLICMLGAHFSSDFTKDQPKPSSLLYVLDTDKSEALWATYEKEPSSWTQAFLGTEPSAPGPVTDQTLSSKYSTGFSFVRKAPVKEVPPPEVTVLVDTISEKQRQLRLRISPQRDVNRLEIFTNKIGLNKAIVNGVQLSEYYLKNRRGSKLLTHYISDNESTELELFFPADQPLELTLYEASNDLLSNPLFTVPPRPDTEIPMPFVLNDAVLVTKNIRFE
ncbi:M28 family peptidase [Robiginitalea sp. IMCC43444]|uniref:M28 family peptidase n=1 Tax=Robiginitalea sp. IMCC43444 TaxID=3459121 RepID=UPI004041BE6F